MPSFDQPPDLQSLTTLVRDCTVSGVARRVLLLRTDLLPNRLSRPHHLRLAQEALEPLHRADRSRPYELAHGRLAISWRGDATDRLDRSLGMLEHLLRDAPLDAPSLPELVRLFELPRDGAALLALATSPTVAEQQQLDAAPPPPPVPLLPPLTAALLDGIETLLAQANVARFARRRTVCRMGAADFTVGWESRFLSLRALMAELAPGHNAFADPALLRRLSRMVDRRLLALMSSGPELRGAGPFSLTLNVGSVLSPEFLRFDGALPPGLRGLALIELRPADVMGNLVAYRFARAFARARGYRVVLRGLTPMLAKLIDLAALDLDFAELAWAPGLVGMDPALLRAGTARWILTGADDAVALGWARSVGIGLVQGAAVQAGAGLALAGLPTPRAAA